MNFKHIWIAGLLILLMAQQGMAVSCTATIVNTSNIIRITGTSVWVNPTCINETLSNQSQFKNNGSGEWISLLPILIDGNSVTFYINNTDTTWLKLDATNRSYIEIKTGSNILNINNTKITGWNITSNSYPITGNQAYIYHHPPAVTIGLSIKNTDFSYLGYGNITFGYRGVTIGGKSPILDNISASYMNRMQINSNNFTASNFHNWDNIEYGLYIVGNDLVVENATRFTNYTYQAIAVNVGSNVTIRNNSYLNSSLVMSAYGIYLYNINNSLVQGNHDLYGNNRTAIHLQNSKDTIIESNYNITTYASRNATDTSGNFYGIDLLSVINSTIRYNHDIYDSEDAISLMQDLDNNSVYENYNLYDNYVGAGIDGGKNTNIYNNYNIYNNLRLLSGNNAVVWNNSGWNNTYDYSTTAAHYAPPTNLTVLNSTYNNDTFQADNNTVTFKILDTTNKLIKNVNGAPNTFSNTTCYSTNCTTILNGGSPTTPAYFWISSINASIIPSSDSVNVTVSTWNTTGDYYKKWNESSSNASVTTQHIIGDFPINTVIQIKKNGVNWNTYTSNATGYITFTYADGYSDIQFEAEASTPVITIPTNSWGMFNNWSVNTNFSSIANNESNDVTYTFYNVTSGEWDSYYIGYSWNADQSINKNNSVMGFFNAQTTINITTVTPWNTTITAGWNMLYLMGTSNQTLTAICIDMVNCTDIYYFNSTTNDYVSTGTDTIQPNQGFLAYVNQTGTWIRSTI